MEDFADLLEQARAMRLQAQRLRFESQQMRCEAASLVKRFKPDSETLLKERQMLACAIYESRTRPRGASLTATSISLQRPGSCGLDSRDASRARPRGASLAVNLEALTELRQDLREEAKSASAAAAETRAMISEQRRVSRRA